MEFCNEKEDPHQLKQLSLIGNAISLLFILISFLSSLIVLILQCFRHQETFHIPPNRKDQSETTGSSQNTTESQSVKRIRAYSSQREVFVSATQTMITCIIACDLLMCVFYFATNAFRLVTNIHFKEIIFLSPSATQDNPAVLLRILNVAIILSSELSEMFITASGMSSFLVIYCIYMAIDFFMLKKKYGTNTGNDNKLSINVETETFEEQAKELKGRLLLIAIGIPAVICCNCLAIDFLLLYVATNNHKMRNMTHHPYQLLETGSQIQKASERDTQTCGYCNLLL